MDYRSRAKCQPPSHLQVTEWIAFEFPILQHFAQRFQSDALSVNNNRTYAETKLSTAWNQAEAAIAYRSHVPLLMICEEDIYREGIFDDEAIASPLLMKIESDSFDDPGFQRTLESWVSAVRMHVEESERRRAEISTRPLLEDHHELTLSAIWKAVWSLSLHDAAVLWGILLFLLSVSFWVGQNWESIKPQWLP